MSLPTRGVSSQSTLGDQIVAIEQTHHTFTRTQVERITGIFSAIQETDTPVPTMLKNCFDELKDELAPHLMKEEHILFPYITALESNPDNPPHSCFGSVANPIRMMRIEHDHVQTLLTRLRELTSNYAPIGDAQIDSLHKALQGLDQDLLEHIEWENDVLFPGALKLEQELASH